MTHRTRPDLLERLFSDSLTGKGARNLSGADVESLLEYASDKPYRLQITEAHMIEPEFDRPMFQYSLSGPLPRTGKGIEADKQEAIDLFREMNRKAQKERYAIRYNVWFSD